MTVTSSCHDRRCSSSNSSWCFRSRSCKCAVTGRVHRDDTNNNCCSICQTSDYCSCSSHHCVCRECCTAIGAVCHAVTANRRTTIRFWRCPTYGHLSVGWRHDKVAHRCRCCKWNSNIWRRSTAGAGAIHCQHTEGITGAIGETSCGVRRTHNIGHRAPGCSRVRRHLDRVTRDSRSAVFQWCRPHKCHLCVAWCRNQSLRCGSSCQWGHCDSSGWQTVTCTIDCAHAQVRGRAIRQTCHIE